MCIWGDYIHVTESYTSMQKEQTNATFNNIYNPLRHN